MITKVGKQVARFVRIEILAEFCRRGSACDLVPGNIEFAYCSFMPLRQPAAKLNDY